MSDHERVASTGENLGELSIGRRGGMLISRALRQEELRSVFGRERLRLCDEFSLSFFVERRGRLGPRPRGLTDFGEKLLLSGGAQRQSKRTASAEAFRKLCGALAGTLTVSPAFATRCWPRKVSSTSPSSTVNISSKS